MENITPDLTTYVNKLRKCVVTTKPIITLNKNLINPLEFSIAITKVQEALESNALTEKELINMLKNKG